MCELWPLAKHLADTVKSANVDTLTKLLANEPSEFHFAISEPLHDPIRDMTLKYFGAQEAAKRAFPTADTVAADLNGLQILIASVFHYNTLNFVIV